MAQAQHTVAAERFPSDEAEARFYEMIEQRIERNLASDRPALTREEVDRKARAVIARALAIHESEGQA